MGAQPHNLCLTLNVVEVRQSSDATMVIEALADTLERVYSICRSKDRPAPKKVIIWAPRLWLVGGFCSILWPLLFLRVGLVGLYYAHHVQGWQLRKRKQKPVMPEVSLLDTASKRPGDDCISFSQSWPYTWLVRSFGDGLTNCAFAQTKEYKPGNKIVFAIVYPQG